MEKILGGESHAWNTIEPYELFHWLMNTTDPDVSDAVRKVRGHAHDPSEKNWEAVPKILQCLEGTMERLFVVGKRLPLLRVTPRTKRIDD